MCAEYRSVEYRLHESLVQIQEMLLLLGFDRELLDAVDSCKELIKTKKYTVAVMGEFKRGKSSLINALLGSKILPADSTPATATVNRITYGAEPKAVITYKDGGLQDIYIHELSDYVTKITPDGEARALQIKEATVFYPTVICQNHIDIVDTPGLNDDPRMTQITIDLISNVDAVVVPIHARAPFSETEKNFICQLVESDGIGSIIFVVTFLDQLDEDDYVYETFMAYIKRRIQTEVISELEKRKSPTDVLSKAHLMLDNLSICGISSSQALESFISNNRELRKKSRFEEFSAMLLHNVTAKQLENATQKAIKNIRHIADQFDLQDRLRRDDMFGQIKNLEILESDFKRYCHDSRKVLDEIFASDYDELQLQVNSLNSNKNYIVSEFVKSLSGVKENTHESIGNALNTALKKVPIDINERCHSEIAKDIRRSFEAAIHKLKAWHSGRLCDTVRTVVKLNIDFEDTAANMLRFVDTVLKNICFSWQVSPIPQTNDLTSFNMIETVVYAADVSVANYIGEIDSALMAIRKNWIAGLAGFLEALSTSVHAEIENKKESHDISYKAYIKNYSVLSDNLKVILEQSQTLVDDLTAKV